MRNHLFSSFILLTSSFLLLAVGCASSRPQGPVYSATSLVRLDSTVPAGEAKRRAIATARAQVRQQLMTWAYQLRINDGRTLEDLAVVDPFVRAVVDDTIRRANIVDQALDDDGVLTLTIAMDLAPLYKLVADYDKHSI